MKYAVVVVLALVCSVSGRPADEAAPAAEAAHPAASGASTPVTIVSQTEVVNPDGSFSFSYETSNGIKVDESGHVKQGPEGKSLNASGEDDGSSGDIQVIQGSYSYTAPDGQAIRLTYIADENGFQPEGDHLPKAPEVPAANVAAARTSDATAAAAPAAAAPVAAASEPEPVVSASETKTETADAPAAVATSSAAPETSSAAAATEAAGGGSSSAAPAIIQGAASTETSTTQA